MTLSRVSSSIYLLRKNREIAKNAYSRILWVHFHILGVLYCCFVVFLLLEQFIACKVCVH
jgi:hypothetical protein